MRCVVSLELSLFVLREWANRTGNTDVGFQIAKLELEVTVFKILSCDLYALDCYKEALFCNKIFCLQGLCICVNCCVVSWFNSLDCLVNNFGYSFLNFVCSAVDILCTSNLDSHTNLDTVSNWIASHIVDVVTTIVILDVNCVVGVTNGFACQCCYNTLNGQCVILWSSNVIFPIYKVVVRKFSVKGNGKFTTFAICNCTDKLVVNVHLFFVNFDCCFCTFCCTNLNRISISARN